MNEKIGEAWGPESVVAPIRKRAEGSFPWLPILVLGLAGAGLVAITLWVLRGFEWWVEQVGDSFERDLAVVWSVWVLIICVQGYRARRRGRGSEPEGTPEA